MLRRRFLLYAMSIYRLIVATVRTLTGLKAKAIKAPAIDVEVDNEIKIHADINPVHKQAKGINARRNVKFSVLAYPVAYNRAAGAYIKGIVISRITALIATASAICKGIRGVVFGRTSGLIAAISTLCKRASAIPMLKKSVLVVGRAFSLAFEKAMQQGKVAAPQNVNCSEIAAEEALATEKETSVSVHASEAMEAKRTLLLSAVYNLRAYIRAEAVHKKEIIVGRLASVGISLGVAFKSIISFVANQASSVVQASAVLTDLFHTFVSDETATASRAYAVNTFLANATKEEYAGEASMGTALALQIEAEEKETHSANMATWIEPVVIDGVLYIRQAHTTTAENGKLVIR